MKFTEILRAFHAVVQLYPKTPPSQVGMGFSLDVRVPEKTNVVRTLEKALSL